MQEGRPTRSVRTATAPPARIALPPLAAEDHVCHACGIRYQDTTVESAVETLAAFPARLRAAVSALDPDSFAIRPQPGTWSPLEYLCHIRDVLVSATIRLYRSQTEDTPAIEPMFNDLRSTRFHYNRRNVAEVLNEITDNTDGFLEQVDRGQARWLAAPVEPPSRGVPDGRLAGAPNHARGRTSSTGHRLQCRPIRARVAVP